MIVLGIETSCDETSFSIVRDAEILSNIISSQTVHSQYGGVVPEYAAREHDRQLLPLFRLALREAGIQVHDIDGIAVTRGPGLLGTLLVGLSFAKGLSFAIGKPLIGINHLQAHIFVNRLVADNLPLPFLALLISGGHTLLSIVHDYDSYELLGSTLDDAAGEAFDKGAKLLHLGYPGGKVIDEFAGKGDNSFHRFPIGLERTDDLHFSFSGLKTALLYLLRKHDSNWVHEHIFDICASYQKAIVDALLLKTSLAVKRSGIRHLAIAGGVAANRELRRRIAEELSDCKIVYPPMELCGDNAAMIAFLGCQFLKNKRYSEPDITAVPNLRISDV